MPEERFTVEHRPSESRYVLLDREAGQGSAAIGEESYLDYTAEDGAQRIMYHTEVSEQYGLSLIHIFPGERTRKRLQPPQRLR